MLKDLARCLYAFYESNSMILKMLDSAHQKTLWLCILPKKLRSEKEYNVIISLSMQRNRKQLFHHERSKQGKSLADLLSVVLVRFTSERYCTAVGT